MEGPKERILLVENDPEISDLISRQTLQPLGYRVETVGAAAAAIQEAVRFAPDAIIANLNLPGLSGKDLLVALSAQGLESPVIVISEKRMEGDIIQAFRLGAADFLGWPVREAEVVATVERVLKQVRSKRERETLARQLKQTNQELQRRVRELTTIFAIGKAVLSVTDQRALFDKIVEGAVYITEADSGWLLLKDERSKAYTLSAFRNLPQSVAEKLNHTWDDGISSLVALSGESLSIHGEPLRRFKVSKFGESALVVPVKLKKDVVGLLVVVRKAPQPFGASNQALLEAVADYASISLVNVRLFRAMEERVRSLQQSHDSATVGERIKDSLLQAVTQELRGALMVIKGNLDLLAAKEMGKLNIEQANALGVIDDRVKTVVDVVEELTAFQQYEGAKQSQVTDLNELIRQAIARFQIIARRSGITLYGELSSRPVLVYTNPSHLARVFDGLLSNAIKFTEQGGQVTLRLERSQDHKAQVSIQDQGVGIERKQLAQIFDRGFPGKSPQSRSFGGLGINLNLIKEIIEIHQGKIWVTSQPGEGSTFYFTLPTYNE